MRVSSDISTLLTSSSKKIYPINVIFEVVRNPDEFSRTINRSKWVLLNVIVIETWLSVSGDSVSDLTKVGNVGI